MASMLNRRSNREGAEKVLGKKVVTIDTTPPHGLVPGGLRRAKLRDWKRDWSWSQRTVALALVVLISIYLWGGRSLRQSVEANVILSNPSRTESNSPLIPHRIVFTDKHNFLNQSREDVSPEKLPFYDNIRKTIRAYREAWNEPEAEVEFLDDEICVDVINRMEPRLLVLFAKTKGPYKADICRAASLYDRGGYYFDIDMEVITPYIADSNVSFVTAHAATLTEFEFFQSFLAVSPGNSILQRSMEYMIDYQNGTRCAGKQIGPCTLKSAYDASPEGERKKCALLVEGPASRVGFKVGTGRGSPFCKFVVHNPLKDVVHFYSRIKESTKCRVRGKATSATSGKLLNVFFGGR